MDHCSVEEKRRKKVVLIDASQRRGANSEIIVDEIAKLLSGQDVSVFHMKEQNCQYCTACDSCQKTQTLFCARRDDITKLLPCIDTCDAILITSPVYDHQMSSLAKLFIERLYAFYNPEHENNSSVSGRKKKAAFLMCCWTGDKEIYRKYAEWTLEGFWQIDVTETKVEIFNGLNEQGEICNHPEYLTRVREVADWIIA